MIIYFSGTGNSFSIAKHMGKQLQEKIMPMKKAYNDHSPNIVFVFPTYCMNIPSYVRTFIKNWPIQDGQKIIGISTSAGASGNSEYTFNKLIEEKGFKVDRFLKITMTDNSFPILFGSNLVQVDIDEEATLKDLLSQKYVNVSKYNPVYPLGERILFNPLMKAYMKKKVNLERCNGCGICAKICPVENIQIHNGKACVSKVCAECYGCIHACPNQAIRARKPIQSGNQFRNKHVTLHELNR